MKFGEKVEKTIKIKCPCCDKSMILSIDNDDVVISEDNQNATEENVSKVLQELNIEFG